MKKWYVRSILSSRTAQTGGEDDNKRWGISFLEPLASLSFSQGLWSIVITRVGTTCRNSWVVELSNPTSLCNKIEKTPLMGCKEKGVFAQRRYHAHYAWQTSLPISVLCMRTLFHAMHGEPSNPTPLRHRIKKNTPDGVFISMAERKGFEPLIPVRVYTISSRAP